MFPLPGSNLLTQPLTVQPARCYNHQEDYEHRLDDLGLHNVVVMAPLSPPFPFACGPSEPSGAAKGELGKYLGAFATGQRSTANVGPQTCPACVLKLLQTVTKMLTTKLAVGH